MKKTTCFRFAKTDATNASIYIDDVIGDGLFGGVSAKAFREQLDALGDVNNIELNINSPGGDVIDGFAIFNMLTEHEASVTTQINGWAASMASIIAMAADPGQIEMPNNAWLMIHNPWSTAIGDSDDLRSIADVMDKMKDHAITAYSRHIDEKADLISAWMDNETWFNGTDAEAMGWNFTFTDPMQIAASVSPFLESEHIPEDAKAWLKRADNNNYDNGGGTNVIPKPSKSRKSGATGGAPEMPTDNETLQKMLQDRYEAGEKDKHDERQPEIDGLNDKLKEADKRITDMQSQHKQELDAERREKQSLNDRLANLLPGTDAPPLNVDIGDGKAAWREALNKCEGDYAKARKQYPEAYQAIRKLDSKE